MKLVKDALTDYDGHTFDTSRVAFCLVIFADIALTAYSVIVQGKPFSGAEFGYGIGAILAGFGFSVAGDNFRRPPPFGDYTPTQVRETYRTTQQTEVTRPPRPSDME